MIRCPHCNYGPASRRFHGYCSHDCEEHSEDGVGELAAAQSEIA